MAVPGTGDCDLRPRPWPSSSACARSVVLEFGVFSCFFVFFPVDASSFFKNGMLTRTALPMLGTEWRKDFGVAVGVGGHQPPHRRAVSGPVFIFKNRHTRQWSLSPPPRRGDAASLPSAPPWEPLCLAPETPEFFVHLLPSPPRSWSSFPPFLTHVYHIM